MIVYLSSKWPNCVESVHHQRIVLEERRRQFVLLNDDRKMFYKIKWDGCCVTQVCASDFIVFCSESDAFIIVELKGSDIGRALSQIEATVMTLDQAGGRLGRFAAIIVCSRFPAIDSQWQRAVLRFRTRFNATVRTVARRRYEITFAEALSD